MQGREARITNVLAETDVITQEGVKMTSSKGAVESKANEDLAYTLVTQRDPENKVSPLFSKAINSMALS